MPSAKPTKLNLSSKREPITFEDIFRIQRGLDLSSESVKQAYIDFWSSSFGHIVMADLLRMYDPFDNQFDSNPIDMARNNGAVEPIKYLLNKIKYLDDPDSGSKVKSVAHTDY